MLDKISNYLKNNKDEFILNFIYDSIKWVLFTITTSLFTILFGNIAIDIINIESIFQYKTIIIACFVSLFAFISFRKFYNKTRRVMLPKKVECDYEIIEREVSFTYGRDISKYEKRLIIESKTKNLNRIYGKYTWSGSEPAKLRCVTKHCNLIQLTRKDSFIEYEIELRKKYKKGKQTECKIEGDLPDSQHTFVPFFSTQIVEPTHKLIMNICIPIKYGVKEIICEEIAIERRIDETSDIITLDSNGEYTWVIDDPKLFYKYSIRWDL